MSSHADAPAAFFQRAYDSFLQAEHSTCQPCVRFFRIADQTICLRFAGAVLEPRITPALAHLACPASPQPDLTICIWDSESTQTAMPPPPWSSEAYGPRGEVRGYNDGRIHTCFHMGANVLNLLDRERALGIFWLRDARRLPYYESGAPLRVLLHWWLDTDQRQFVHAAAVGTHDGGILLAGRGGSGKSTTALACLASDLVYVSDDYCLVATRPSAHAYSVYNTAKVNADNVHRVPHLAAAISNADRLGSEKALIFLQQHLPHKIVPGFPVRAILMPRITGRAETRLAPTSPTAGLRALAPSTIFQLSGAGSSAFEAMADLVRQVPCYVLELGTRIPAIPDVIASFLAEGNGA